MLILLLVVKEKKKDIDKNRNMTKEEKVIENRNRN